LRNGGCVSSGAKLAAASGQGDRAVRPRRQQRQPGAHRLGAPCRSARAGFPRGVSSEKRAPQLPDVPAIAEFYPGFSTGTWNGYLAPAGTPKPIIDRLAEEIAKAVREPATIDRLHKIGVEPFGNKPAEFAALLKRNEPVWRDAVKAARITPE